MRQVSGTFFTVPSANVISAVSDWRGLSAPPRPRMVTILVGAEDEHLYAVAPDGTLLWLLPFAGDVDTTPAIGRDGTIYVAGDDAHLHAFR